MIEAMLAVGLHIKHSTQESFEENRMKHIKPV